MKRKYDSEILLKEDYDNIIKTLSYHTEPKRETVYTLLVLYGHSEKRVEDYLNENPV